ncbi:dipeptide/oligopeptide/nickel ABC transporter permease/ATP-binding protein [Leucobacter sp. UT-8R-CII-1-4]|uniref:dipeptide/oligopeptide/nickel ABC transporter permease/ATP-binding protein n=1 Tax=Leucobacter sp. UT-8R-CII-1-4 TaxID=3040075 RepID=UPI0024A834E9|nr:dipeptide/oligopeptide/nickel ABC transporter permease/ATP-binding protein [Leucobacter sp. UT-8R-CII-1-4]MDI6022666.1 dipeptide/oligopeptide/nickel ABC transporter permease/ATP-binding protein [Leucobacter sp. UT-8R-CII-1-4]
MSATTTSDPATRDAATDAAGVAAQQSAATETGLAPTSRARAWLRTLKSPSGLIGFLIVLFWVLAAIFAPMLLGHRADEFDSSARLAGPSAEHWLGTDALGRDVLARVLVATRLTFALTFGAVAIGLVLGVFVGALAAVLGNAARQVLYQLIAAATAFPSIILALLLATMMGRSGVAAMIGLALASVPSTARLVVNLTSTVAASDYVAGARLLGVPKGRLMARYIVPNVAEPIVTLMIVTLGSCLMMMAALSFLGIGVQLPQYDWGGMVAEAMKDIYRTPWTTIGPAAAIVSAGIGFSLFGEKLAEQLDPRGNVMTMSRLLRKATRSVKGRGRGASQHTTAVTTVDVVEAMPEDTVLGIQGLVVTAGGKELVHGVDVIVRRGERIGIVGESGSGKSLTISALAHMLPGVLSAEMDSHVFLGKDLRGVRAAELRGVIGAKMPMIFQDPMSSLNPALTIGRQMGDKLAAHTALRGAAAKQHMIEALESVGIPEPERRLRQHPHELSGGQRQRVMIAMATLGDPQVILADEPTTALDVSVQAQVIDLLREVNDRDGTAIVMVSHDLALISQVCERIIVMYDGRIVEEGPMAAVIGNPQHPYTRSLLGAVPDLSAGTSHRLTTIDDYSWNTDEYREQHPVPRHEEAATAPMATTGGER